MVFSDGPGQKGHRLSFGCAHLLVPWIPLHILAYFMDWTNLHSSFYIPYGLFLHPLPSLP